MTSKRYPITEMECADCHESFDARAYPHYQTESREYSTVCAICAAVRRCNSDYAISRAAVLLRDSLCRMEGCNARAIDAHHMLQVTHGGTNDIVNLVGLCRECHRTVHAALYDAARLDSAKMWNLVNGWYADWTQENRESESAVRAIIYLAYYRAVVGRRAAGVGRAAAQEEAAR
jgi:5-methylcytosine-specific restriction endonuclease McrA